MYECVGVYVCLVDPRPTEKKLCLLSPSNGKPKYMHHTPHEPNRTVL